MTRLIFLLGALAAPFLPAPWSLLALAAAVLAWLRMRPARQEAIVVVLFLGLAAAALGFRWAAELGARASAEEQIEAARRQYSRLWDGLQSEAADTAVALGRPPQDRASTLEAFRLLAEIEPASGRGRRSLLLVDTDGVAVAWSGEGLLHEFRADQVPREGLHYKASFRAVTLFAVAPLDGSRRPWRVVAGSSFPTYTLPFPADISLRRWSLVDRPEQARPGTLLVPHAGAPTLVLDRLPEGASPSWTWVTPLAWGAIAFALLALAVLRAVGMVLPLDAPPSRPSESRWWTFLLFIGGVFAAGMAAQLAPVHLGVLVAGLGLAVWGLFGRPAGPPPRTWVVAARGAGVILLLAGLSWASQWGRPPLDLAAGLAPSAEVLGLRIAFTAVALGLLVLSGRRAGMGEPPGDAWTWGACAALFAGAAVCDVPVLALPLLAAGGAGIALYANGQRLERGLALVMLVVLAAVAASAVWETTFRLRLRSYAREEVLPHLTPPSPAAVDALSAEIQKYFAEHDLSMEVVRSPAGLERQDLAYALWRGSPMARPQTLSAIVVELRGSQVPSSFSFGMPLTEQGRVDWTPARWEELRLPRWEQALVHGTVELRSNGAPWGTISYWLLPRPGFDPREASRLRQIEAGLLRGGPAAGLAGELEGKVLYALYQPDGRAVLSPWDEAPSLPAGLRRRVGGVFKAMVPSPSGTAHAFIRSSDAGWQVVYLPVPTVLEAVERTALSALGVLLVGLLAAPPVLLLGLPRSAFRDLLQRSLRSYSKRLVIVYTFLLLLPLVLLNAVLVGAMDERLQRQQREAGEAALDSAQQILAERLLNLEPGFGVDEILGDRLLIHLAEIVHREVNLYYGSNIHASSRHELFTAGLLPNRIPGESYSRLALLGNGLSSRMNQVAGTKYLEVYAPLRLPGEPESGLFLSMPLLAQQEEAEAVLANLRRHAMLATAALFGLLVAVGTRLARNFTRPLMELVDGTRRIAAGATSLDLSPSELELAALVEAVDEMARRIAEGRERLLREKQVVERMVENITSGVVSLDADGRVLMRNRVAAEMLGAEVGESLEGVVASRERLEPMAAFLAAAGREMARTTVRLPAPDGEREWSIVWVPLPGAGEPAALLVLEDATEVLRGQRLLAWAEMARIIAHEIKNPLTPIRLSAEHMREVWKRDPDRFDGVFERCTTNILSQVEELRTIASEFSAYSALLEIDPRPGDLAAAVADLVEGYRAAPPAGVHLDLDMDGPLPARFDAKLLQRAVRNILDNALRAAGAGGGHVMVRVGRENGAARIAVLDDGPGVRPENLLRIFDPYFSTHDTGTGLGLPIARRVVEEHGGSIIARNRTEGGLEVAITLPV